MANMTVDIATGFYASDSLPFANQRCVNLYPNFPQAPALKSSSIFNVSGLVEAANISRLSENRNRGSWVFQDIAYFINGGNLYKLEQIVNFDKSYSYIPTQIGKINGSGFCSIADNGIQMMIIDSDGLGYIYQPAATPQFQSITDNGFSANGKPQSVVFVDSYFVVTTDQAKAIISAPFDGLDWNSLDFVSAESDPDGIVAPFIFKNQLYLLGAVTTETYSNIGGAGVPFQRVNGFVLSQGCSAPFSVRNIGNAVLWIGSGENEQPAVWIFNGGEPQKVSTTAIDNKLNEASAKEITNSFSWAYSHRGHDFVGFTFGDSTFVYDLASGKWHERLSDMRDQRGVRFTKRCRINSVISAYNELLVGDSEDGRIGIIDVDVYKEYDEPLRSFFTTSPLYDLGNSFSLPSIEMVCESGVGNTDKPNPQIRLEISRDGAVFEDPRTRFLGEIGNRKIRQVWYKNGRVSRFCIFKVTVSDPVKRRMFALELNYKVGSRSG